MALSNIIWSKQKEAVIKKIIPLPFSEIAIALYRLTGNYDTEKGYEYVYFGYEHIP
jgi:hypothetical protein